MAKRLHLFQDSSLDRDEHRPRLIFRWHSQLHRPRQAVAHRAAEQLGWDDTPAGQQKRLEDLALLQELMAVSKRAADHAPE